MRKTSAFNIPVSDRILVSMPDFAGYCSCGRYTADKIAEDAGAVVFVGKRKLVNLDIAKRYLTSIAGN